MQTLQDVLHAVQEQDPALPLVFETDTGEISPGYHVTEIAHATLRAIDCAGGVETSTQTRLQLLDGCGQSHMRVGKFAAIVEKSVQALPAVEAAPLRVEFGHDNASLMLMSVAGITRAADRVVITLASGRAVCRPAERVRRDAATSSTHGRQPVGSPSACCARPGSDTAETARCV
ncbi:MAG: DUF6428 family protein [Pseudomonadota bacterium]